MGPRTREDSARDRMLALAVLKSVEIIGEAASKVSDESRKAIPELAQRLDASLGRQTGGGGA